MSKNKKTGSKHLEPTPGKCYVPMPVSKEQVVKQELDASKVTYRKIGSKSQLVYMVEIEEEKHNAYMRDFWKDDKYDQRKNRCIIQGKSGQAIVCPTENSCYGCPNAGKFDTKTAAEASLDELYEESGFEPADTNNSIGEVEVEILLEQFWDHLDKIEPKLAEISKLGEVGYKPKEISVMLGIKLPTLYKCIKRIQRYFAEFIG